MLLTCLHFALLQRTCADHLRHTLNVQVAAALPRIANPSAISSSMIRRSAFRYALTTRYFAVPVRVYVVAVILRKIVDEYTAVPKHNCSFRFRIGLSTATHFIRSTQNCTACRSASPSLLSDQRSVWFGDLLFIASTLDSASARISQCEPFLCTRHSSVPHNAA